MLKEATLWDKGAGKRVICHLCLRKCEIDDGHVGWCQTRINKQGTLYAITYGRVSSMSISSIEKKPLYHFFPGTLWFSLGSLGCNFACRGCQSWEFSHCTVREKLPAAKYLSPEQAVAKALQNRCRGIAFTYNEPTMWFEYMLDVCKLAKTKRLSTCCVTNGYLTPGALDIIAPYLDGFCVDIKGGFMESYTRIADVSDINIIFSNASDAKRKYAMHVEIVTNVIPGFNSSERELKDIACWIYAELGKDTPWHLTRFFPYGEMKEISPTPLGLLESMRQMAMREGLLYVYIGNVPGHKYDSTYCQNCKKAVIKRREYDEFENNLKDGHCPYCDALIFGRFPY